MLYQQGDVLIESSDAVPPGAVRIGRTNGRYVLALGEATAHPHAVTEDVELYASGGVLYCRARETFVVRHEEHRPVTVPPGTYQVRRVRQFDYFSGEVLDVRD